MALDSSSIDSFRVKLTGVEGKFTENYFKQVFQLRALGAGYLRLGAGSR